jgi:hypothetical protein
MIMHGIFALLYISDFPGYRQNMLRIPYISLETQVTDAAVGGNSPGFGCFWVKNSGLIFL